MSVPSLNRGKRIHEIKCILARMRDECLLLYKIRARLEQERHESLPVSKTLALVENEIKSREGAFVDLEREAFALVGAGIQKVRDGK